MFSDGGCFQSSVVYRAYHCVYKAIGNLVTKLGGGGAVGSGVDSLTSPLGCPFALGSNISHSILRFAIMFLLGQQCFSANCSALSELGEYYG